MSGPQDHRRRSEFRRAGPGIDYQISPGQLEDLLAFLLLEGLEPARISRSDPPRPNPRSVEELASFLSSAQPDEPLSQLRILLVAGPKDHGPDEHDYPLWLERWSRLLSLNDTVRVTTVGAFPTDEQLAGADVAVFYNANPGWNAEKAVSLDKFHKKGGGAVYVHYAVDGGKDPTGMAERVGLAFTLGSRFRHGELDLVFTRDHPITQGFSTLHFTDESPGRHFASASPDSRLLIRQFRH